VIIVISENLYFTR